MTKLTEDERWLSLANHNRIARYPVFVETGTSEGFTTQSMIPHFERIVSIEFDPVKYVYASRWALHEPKVSLIHGDSSVALEWVLEELIEEKCFFWLDAHYNEGWERAPKDCPTLDELDHILYRYKSIEPIIFIDDARLFGTDPSYPKVSEIQERIGAIGYKFENKNDIIRIYPPHFDFEGLS